MDVEKTAQEEIDDVRMGRPHVVVLGAGASRAAFPGGDRNGRKLPLMNDFAATIGLDGVLRGWGIDPARNFEDVFSDLHERGEDAKLDLLREVTENYFGPMALPDEPTLYDHLILSLRAKDMIATFNWDPLIVEAFKRNLPHIEVPRLVFLHGNVAIGSCDTHNVKGFAGQNCPRCRAPLQRSQLLYPVKDKDYASDPFIASQWRGLKWGFENAFMITVFGYSAPKTDRAAIEAMKTAWGSTNARSLEQTEFITIEPAHTVRENWDDFVHTHHYDVHNDFYESWIAKHPRRTGEAYLSQFLDARFIEDNAIPRRLGLSELWAWFEELRAAELTAGPRTRA